jgi:glycerophosphoryl diester phosphodiesterase
MYFELDFSFTRDDQLVCLHDWNESFKRTIGTSTAERITLKEFERLVSKSAQYTNCTLQGLDAWMGRNGRAYIVTDVKTNNIKALKPIFKSIHDANERIIPQIFQPSNYLKVKALGYEKIIWTLYHFQGDDDVLDWVDKFQGHFAVAMPQYRAEGKLHMSYQRGIFRRMSIQ